LCVTVDKTLKYSLSAVDVLHTPGLDGSNIVDGMDGHLEEVCFRVHSPIALVSQSKIPWDASVLMLHVVVSGRAQTVHTSCDPCGARTHSQPTGRSAERTSSLGDAAS
jgi:hypothetical protein